MGEAEACAIGVVIPAHDEANVIERRLRNLAAEDWPKIEDGRSHQVVVVCDHSSDGTFGVAERAIGQLGASSGVRFAAVRNQRAAGKAHAIATGLSELESVDWVLLTDADVIQRRGSLDALARAFAAEPRLILACGAQEFVRDLESSGQPRAAGGGEPVPCPGLYDRVTAWVRAFESRRGLLFSVHGQLLAWRIGLGLVPRPGIAADDLDLMFQARAAGGRVELIREARFLEPKLPAGEGKQDQELRRARAYFQVLGATQGSPARNRGRFARVQLLAYRWLPYLAPELLVLGTLVPCGWVFWMLQKRMPWAFAAGLAVALLSLLLTRGPGRQLVHLAAVIRRARAERSLPSGDRWGTVRT